MIDSIKQRQRGRFGASYLLFIIGVCTFSDNASTSLIFYMCAALYAGFSILELVGNRWLLSVDSVLKAEFMFLLVMAASILWQHSSAYYATRLTTTAIIVLFCVFTTQWFQSSEDVYIALGCMVWGNVLNCLYRLGTGGIKEVMGMYTANHSLIVGANDLAVTMVIVFSFSIFLYRQWNKKIYIATAVLFFAVGLMTASRKALIGFLLIIVIQYALKDKHFIKNFFVAGVLVAVFWLVLSRVELFTYSFQRLQQLIGFSRGDASVIDHSSEIRRSMRQIGFSAFLQRPILGYGVGYSYTNLAAGTYLHNNFIELGVSLGIAGLVTFYLPHLMITGAALSIRNNRTTKITVISVILTMLIMDYGAVTYFNKFILVTLCVLFAMVKMEKQEKIDMDMKKA